MAITVPTSEPLSLRSGDTWAWRREDLSDYPASVWTLTYYFRNATSKFSIVATADGDNFAVSVAKATTAAFDAGDYDWEAIVTTVDDAYRIDFGRVTVEPDLTVDAVYDGRSFARTMLEAIESALLSKATGSQLDMVQAVLADRSMQYDTKALMALRTQFRAEVNREDAGIAGNTRILVKFA